MPNSAPLSTAAISEFAAELLERGGYKVFRQHSALASVSGTSLIAEDPYCVLALVIFDTWVDLSISWATAQAGLVSLMSTQLGQLDPKNWDGYLLLFCPVSLTAEQLSEKAQIESNLARVRKMIFTDEQLVHLADVEDSLRSVLPLNTVNEAGFNADILKALPMLITGRHLTPDIVAGVVEAFRDGRPLPDEIARLLGHQTK